jgi:GT2 family glycosyltransferase
MKCLESLEKITYPNYEVIVVDNGSENHEAEFLKANSIHAQVVANGSNLGFAGGNNVGIRRALGESKDYVLLLNNDTTVEPSFLSILVDKIEKDKSIGVIAPRLYNYDDHSKIQLPGILHVGGNVDTLSGAAFLVRRETWEDVGLFDEVFYPAYCEDRDFFERVKKHGYKLVCVAESKVYHKMGATSSRYKGLTIYLITKYIFLVVRRHGACKLLFQMILIQFIAAMKSKRLKTISMFVKGITEGIILFIQNPKARW